MATVNKDFKIKSGLIVEGTSGTINGYDILTKDTASTQFIIDTVGGSATSTNTPDTVVLRDGNGDFAAGTITADLIGDVTGTVSDISNHDTGDLAEGSNLYFTAQRAVTANTGLWDNVGSADTAYTNAVAAAGTYTDGEISTALTTAQGYADTAENNANTYTDTKLVDYTKTVDLDTTIDGYGYLKSADLTGYATETYVDTAVSNLVDGAPALLDTLNELAAAINDNPNYATDVANLVAGKQDTLTAGTGITIDSGTDTISVTANTYDAYGSASTAQSNAEDYADTVAATAEYNAKGYADGLAINYDPAGAATTAENNANSYTDGEISTALTTAQGYANTAEANANSYTDTAITNLNLGTTYDAYGAAATAESNANTYTDNAIASGDSTASPTYQALNVTWVRKEEATWTNVATASTAVAHTFGTSEGSVKYLVRVYNNNKSQVSEILATTDSTNNVAIVEYGTVYTSDNPLATATVEWNSATNLYELKVTTANNASEILVAATLLAYND